MIELMDRLTRESGRGERSDAVANRQRILDAAREVFAQRGLDAEVREIAKRAGVGIGTVYRHFGSREGLLTALKVQSKEDLRRRLQSALETHEPATALRAIIRAGADACEQFGALAEAVLSGKLDKLGGGRGEFMELLTKLLRLGIQEGTFRSDLDVSLAAATLESIFTSGAFLELAAQRSYPAAADAVADFFLKAIAATPGLSEPA